MTRPLKFLCSCLLMAALMAGFPVAGVQAQFFDQKDVFDQTDLDYEKIFKEGLSANGKTLNLSGKKIGDEGLELQLTKDYLKKVNKLEERYNKISQKVAHLKAQSKSFAQLQ